MEHWIQKWTLKGFTRIFFGAFGLLLLLTVFVNGYTFNSLDREYKQSMGKYVQGQEYLEAENQINQKTNTYIQFTSVFILVAGGIFICLGYYSINAIRKEIIKLGDDAAKVARGDFTVSHRTNSDNEIGEVANCFADMVDTIKKMESKISNMDVLFSEGELDIEIDETEFQGHYRNIIRSTNSVVMTMISRIFMILQCTQAYSEGDFSKNIERMKGKQAVLPETFDRLQHNLISVNRQIKQLIHEAKDGNLTNTIDTTDFKGAWLEITEGLNELIQTIQKPISEVSDVLTEVSNCNFQHRVEGDYKGQFKEVKEAVNKTIENTEDYINEISNVLSEINQQKLNIQIQREYAGEFKIIGDAINGIISTLNDVMRGLSVSTEHVAMGSSQISNSSMTLAKGASEQADIVDKINKKMESIAQETSKNANNAAQANQLTLETKDHSLSSKKEMEEMLTSMSEIEKASLEISKIIKVIEDIAFQTNLLALNAAVEAARAGQHGKGFAVVAEEVRNLAARSQKAVAETTELIHKTVDIVSHGTKIADKTANSMNNMVQQITRISNLIEGISKASIEQNTAIEDINSGMLNISDVTQSNAAVAEECASASQELSSQSDVLHGELSKFVLGKREI